MKILVVEDEEHKRNDLVRRLEKNGVESDDAEIVKSVREAVLRVCQQKYDLIVLDMALPTFSKETDTNQVGGLAQSSGGIEILRTLSANNIVTKIIIVTQYPEIIVNGINAKPSKAASIISERYKQQVIGVVIYSYDTPEWEEKFDRMVRGVRG